LNEFLRLDERFALEDWHDGSIFATLREFEDRFIATGTEEGAVMAVVIGFVLGELSDGRQRDILTEVRRSERAHRLLEQGIRERDALLRAVEEANAGGNAGANGSGSADANADAKLNGDGDWARRNALLTTASLSLQ
jgi:hypothetical protein